MCSSTIRFVPSSSTNNFAHAQTLSQMSSLSGRMNIQGAHWVLKLGYNCCFFLNFVPLHIENPYNFEGTRPILGVKNPLQGVNGHADIAWVNIGFFTGFKKIKQQHISFVLGYLRMILWKISPAINIKHLILATFNIKNKINSDSLYAFKLLEYQLLVIPWTVIKVSHVCICLKLG